MYGFHPKLISWVEPFALIISGVPQGAVLGPILFLIYIIDITNCVRQSTIKCFTDDTRICMHVNY